MSRAKKITLKNGLRVLLVSQPSSLATTVLITVAAGSKYETKEINGLSHFLEHMCFKGTKQRPTAMTISSELEGLGAANNAFTSEENTAYFAKSRNESAEKILEIVADTYLNSVFDPAEIEKERGVIIQEIKMYEDLPKRKVWEILNKLMYGDQPAGWPVIGPEEVIKKLTREDFVEYRKNHYVPQATILCLCGGSDLEKLTAQAENIFGAMPTGEKSEKLAVVEEQAEVAEKIVSKATDQTHIILACRSFSIFNPHKYALMVLSDILGGGMSSRLFQAIREEMGAAYYVYANDEFLTDHGFLAVAAGIDQTRSEEVIKRIVRELNRFRNELVKPEELERAKEHIAGQLVLSLETSDSLAFFYSQQEILERDLADPETLIRKIRAVTAEDVQSVARTVFKNRNLNLAAIGPFAPDTSFKNILQIEE
jgi:predicted Zn-dependent peptidase